MFVRISELIAVREREREREREELWVTLKRMEPTTIGIDISVFHISNTLATH
jgi:hypothetical protein